MKRRSPKRHLAALPYGSVAGADFQDPSPKWPKLSMGILSAVSAEDDTKKTFTFANNTFSIIMDNKVNSRRFFGAGATFSPPSVYREPTFRKWLDNLTIEDYNIGIDSEDDILAEK